MNIVDSSGWLEYFADSPQADFFTPAIEDSAQLLVPVICIYEVFKRIATQRGLNIAQTSIADMYHGKLVNIDDSLALSAAQISLETKLPMADSLILATARANQATLWTQDEHFKGMEGVQYIARP
jgi:predicted nucleic acid-binding protein